MKITEVIANQAVYCATEAEADRICRLMHDAGMTWDIGHSYLTNSRYNLEENYVCYDPINGTCSSLDFFLRKGYVIFPSRLILSHELDNTVIKTINYDQRERAIQWWGGQGIETSSYNRNTGLYCGLINGKFSFYSLRAVLYHVAKVIDPFVLTTDDATEIPELLPVEMEVSNQKNFPELSFYTKEVIGKIGEYFIDSIGEKWRFSRPIRPQGKPKLYLTKQQIAERFGCKVDEIQIETKSS